MLYQLSTTRLLLLIIWHTPLILSNVRFHFFNRICWEVASHHSVDVIVREILPYCLSREESSCIWGDCESRYLREECRVAGLMVLCQMLVQTSKLSLAAIHYGYPRKVFSSSFTYGCNLSLNGLHVLRPSCIMMKKKHLTFCPSR